MAQATQAKPFLYAVANEHRIERTTDTKSGREEIASHRGRRQTGNPRQAWLNLAEDKILAMLRAAIERKVFTPKFLDGLRKVLGDRRVSRPPPADGPRW